MPNRTTTGIENLDAIINGLRMGDNVVWQVDDMEDYGYFAALFVRRALQDHRRVVYFRFAQHRRLVEQEGVAVYELDAKSGFEAFSAQIHAIATQEGEGVFYVFDCLSDLLSAWATDLHDR